MSHRVRILRGIGALAGLLLGLVGVPVALALMGGNSWPGTISWSAVRDALFTRDDGTLLVGLVALVGWVAWGVFVLSVLTELVAVLSRNRIAVDLPGLAGPQRLAAGLLLSVVAMVTAPVLVPAAPTAPAAPAQPVNADPPEPASVIVPPPAAGTGAVPEHRLHIVRAGDDLWSLAERYYGAGREWRRIASANPTVLTGGPDRLQPGWRLAIPDAEPRPRTDDPGTVTVRRGETLSSIAARELGAAERWRELYEANGPVLSDPDELEVGLRLALPGSVGEKPDARPEGAEPEDREYQREARIETGPEGEPERTPDPTRKPTAEPAPSADAAPSVVATPTVEATPAPEAPTTDAPAADEPPPGDTADAPDDEPASPVVPLVAIGSLLAAGLLEGLAWRRSVQLQTRPMGRRIPPPPPAALPVTAALRRTQRPLSLRTLDRAMRSVAAQCRLTKTVPPALQLALVGDDRIELVLAEETTDAPGGFTVAGRSWLLRPDDAGYLSSVSGLGESLRPWPALVTLGRDDQDRQVLADLEWLRLLHLDPAETFDAAGVLAAMAVELSFSPWADEMILTLVGSDDRLPAALGKHNVTHTDDLDALLDRLEQRADAQRAHHPYAVLSQHRIDPDLADPWAPEIVLISETPTAAQRTRLAAVLNAEPQVTMAAVVIGRPLEPAAGHQELAVAPSWFLGTDPADSAKAVLAPGDRTLTPQRIEAPARPVVLDLVRTTGSEETTPAPWWWHDTPAQSTSPPDNVTYLEARSATWGRADTERGSEIVRVLDAADETAGAGAPPYPTLQLLGPINLVGATGPLPPRAAKQCLEYCAWLLEHPGTTAQAMATALAVAEGTRRSNMSRLRTWLGQDPERRPYLPDAYSGRISLHHAVSSDWHRLQILTGGRVNRASDDGLQAALELVRGAPLADAAPHEWHWAEELRTDMVSCVRDIGAVLTDRALTAGDIDLARWAAARALVAAPGDELLLAARIRTEHLAGNPVETERLTLQLAAQARTLGVDLDPETVALLQRVMEGRVRARLA